MLGRCFQQIILGTVISLAPLLAGCGKQAEETVRISLHTWPGYDTLILARDKGFLDQSRVRLIELPSASESIRAFQNHSVDGALLTVDEVLRLADHGHDPRIILVMDFSNGADAILARPGIKDIASLKGQSVGVESNALGAYVLARALSKANLSAADVNIVSMPIGETEIAYDESQVDAVVTYEPHRTAILEAGGQLLFDSTHIPGEITDVLVIHGESIEKSPNALQHLVDSQFRALSYLEQNQQEAAAIMARHENISAEQLLDSLQLLILPDREDNQKLLAPTDDTIPNTIGRLNLVMREQRLLENDVANQEYRDDRFVKGQSN